MPSVRRALEVALSREAVPAGSGVAVLLVTDDEIAAHHARYLNSSEPTDVISWPSGEDAGGHLGDVMVSCERAAAQAAALGHSTEREVCVLAVHGLLHLLGWDDLAPGAQEVMQARVDALVAEAFPQ